MEEPSDSEKDEFLEAVAQDIEGRIMGLSPLELLELLRIAAQSQSEENFDSVDQQA